MEETDNLKTDLLPYLNLQDSEEILVINRYNEKKILPIKDLAKYHDPSQLPKKFFPIKGKNYVYYDIDIVTNYRVIFFCLNLRYLKDDGIAPLSDVFHIENYLVWVYNENIKDCTIEFGEGLWKGISIAFNFYYDNGKNVEALPLRVVCSNYPDYLEFKEVLNHPLNLNSVKIKYQEQQRINSIRGFNRTFNQFGTILLAILGAFLFMKMTDDEITFNMSYIDFGLYLVYVIFFISYNIYWNRTLKKDTQTFFGFTAKDFTWYKGPSITFIVFVMCGLIIFVDMAYSLIIPTGIWSFLASFGSIACFLGLSMLTGWLIDKKKKKISV